MLFISTPRKNGAGAVAYYLKGKEDYYLKGLDREGRWYGDGAAILGLQGKVVERAAFENLLDGFSPDRAVSLVQNAGHCHRQSFWDLPFNPPKPVSVLWALVPEDLQREMEQAHKRAVEAATKQLEKTAAVTRRGKGGKIEEKALLLFAVFPEGTSRALDPHLHSHVVLVNLAFRQDGTTGTLHSIRFFEMKMALGKTYQNQLAFELQQLGLIIEPQKVGFHVVGVPHELCRANSKRRQQVEKWLEQSGLHGPIAAREAALETRPKKQDIPPAELFAKWKEVAESFGWGQEQAIQLFQNRTQQRVLETGIKAELSQPATSGRKQPRYEQRAADQPAPTVASNRRAEEVHVRSRRKKLRPSPLPFFHVEWHTLLDKSPWLPPKRRAVHIKWQQVFPTLPSSRARSLKVPYIALSLPKIEVGPKKEFKPHWWTIRAKYELFLGGVANSGPHSLS